MRLAGLPRRRLPPLHGEVRQQRGQALAPLQVLEGGQPEAVPEAELLQVAQPAEPRRQRGQPLVVEEVELLQPAQPLYPLR